MEYILGVMENILIREIKDSDVTAVARLWFELSKLHEDFTPYYKIRSDSESVLIEHVRDVRKRGCVILVAESDGVISGFVSGYVIRRNPHLDVGIVGKVDNFYVSEKYRRNGIGSKLLTTLIETFRKQGVVHFEISCDLQNPDALRLYRKLGFVDQKILLIKSD
jgi:ribosomal protein S18 acetylase RimI-like enzyme